MESNTQEKFICPLCGCELLWMPVSHIFVCEHCKQSFSEDAKFYLRNEDMPREKSNGNAAAMRVKRLLKSCARWILTHDIHGNMAKELLAECKEVLHDDGQFLLSEEGAENGKV